MVIGAAIGAEAQTVHVEDSFEDGFSKQWDRVDSLVELSTDNPYSGTQCARMSYNYVEEKNTLYVEFPAGVEELEIEFRLRYEETFRFAAGLKIFRTGFYAEDRHWSLSLESKDDNQHFIVRPVHSSFPNNYVSFQETQIQAGQWEHYRYRIKLNTPGQRDGILRGWVDGVLAYDKDDADIRGNLSDGFKYIWLVGNYSDSGVGEPGTALPGAPHYVYVDDVLIRGVSSTVVVPTLTAVPVATVTSTPILGSPTPTPTPFPILIQRSWKVPVAELLGMVERRTADGEVLFWAIDFRKQGDESNVTRRWKFEEEEAKQ